MRPKRKVYRNALQEGDLKVPLCGFGGVKYKCVCFFAWNLELILSSFEDLSYLVSYYYTVRSDDVKVLKSRWNFVKAKTTTPGNNIYTLMITFIAFTSFISSKFQTQFFPYKLSYYAWAICVYIYVIHRLGGPYWEKLCPRSWVPPTALGGTQTEGTVSPNRDRPRPANNIFIFFLLRF